MSKKLLYRNIARLLAVGFLYVQFNIYAADAIPSDVKGWGDTRWGMNPNNVKEILGDQWDISGDQVLKIDNYEIIGYNAVVRLDFRKNNRLRRVVILIRETGEHIREEDVHYTLQKIRTYLTAQYGEGYVSKDLKESAYTQPGISTSGQEQMEIKWTFPSSIILLKYTFAGAIRIGHISQEKHLTIFIKYDEKTSGE